MHIPIWLILVAVVLGFVFLTPARQVMIDFFAAAWNFICYAAGRIWDFLRGAAPVAGTVALTTGAIIGRILLFVALAIILFITILYATLGAGIMAAGIITGHWKAALLLLTALMFWGSLSLIPSIGMFRPLTIASRYVVRPVVILLSIYLIICTGWWAAGQIAPEMHRSADRLMDSGSTELVDLMDSKSIETEGKLGKIGRVDYAGVHGYKEVDGTLFTANLQKGKYVRLVTEIPGQKLSKASGGMVWVMLQNDQGDFVRGSLWMVHPHKVNWDWQQQDAAAKALAEVERAAKAQAEAAKVEATKEAAQKAAAKKAAEENLSGEWTLRYSDKFSEKTVTVEVNENNLMITSGQVVFQGRKTENCKYEGKWFNEKTMNQGRFALAFINKEQANGRFVSKDGEIFPIFMKKK